MEQQNKYNEELMKFLDRGTSPYHAVLYMKDYLENQGFCELSLKEKWDLKKGERYYINLQSTLIAFDIGMEADHFRITGSHTDSPCFLVKPNPDMQEKNYMKLNIEGYGGSILNTWLDRPLSMAGRVELKGKSVFETETKFVDFQAPVAIIPNVAIHQNREVNKGQELNKQKDMLPIIGICGEEMTKDFFETELAKKIDTTTEEILSYEIFLYPYEKASYVGFQRELISSARLDNLAMFYTNVAALAETRASKSINMMIAFDNEEVGSMTRMGADSMLLSSILYRIANAMNMCEEEYYTMIQRSFLVSCDMAHAIHPNSPEKTDPTNQPKINQGPVIKLSYAKKYTSDSYSTAVFMQICEKAGVPCQVFVNRSDQIGGMTIGPIAASKLAIPSVDIGNPMLSMHSSRELMGAKDIFYLIQALKVFYQE